MMLLHNYFRHTIYFFCFLFSINTCYSQLKFQKVFGSAGAGDYYRDVIQTTDGGFAIIGKTDGYSSSNDIILTRTNAKGVVMWSKTYASSGYDEGEGIVQAADGGFVFTGQYAGAGYSCYIAKTDANGTLLWTKYFGGGSLNRTKSIALTKDGNYIITGYYDAGIATDVVLAKVDDSGNMLWHKKYGDNGGTQHEWGYDVQATSDNGYIIAGRTDAFGAGASDVYLIKTDGSGNLQWTKTYGSASMEEAHSVIQLPDDGYMLTGATTGLGAGGFTKAGVYVVRTDKNGNLLWDKGYSATGSPQEGNEIIQTSDGNFIVGGRSSFASKGAQAILFKIDMNGTVLWSKMYGNNLDEYFYGFTECSDKGIMAVGACHSWAAGAYGGSQDDFYLVKTDENGVSGCFEYDVTLTIGTGGTVSTGGVENTGISTGTGGTEQTVNPDTLTLCFSGCTTTALIKGPANLCIGDTSMLIASGGGTYLWNNGSADSILKIIALKDSIYKVFVTKNGCTDSAKFSIKVSPPPIAKITGDTLICKGEKAFLKASGGSSYLWSNGSNDSIIIVIPNTDSTIKVVVSNGSCKDSAKVTIYLTPAISASVNKDTVICSGQTIQLAASGGSSYTWFPSASLNNAAIANPIASPTVNTTYTVIVASGSCDPDTAYVKINTKPSVIAMVSGNASICNGDSVLLDASGGTNYQWIPISGISSPTSASTYSAPTATTTYSVIVSNGLCPDDTATVIVSVVPGITTGVSNNAIICMGDSIILTASGGSNYSWSPALSLSSPIGNPVVAFPAVTTTYTVTITSGSCAPATNTVTITVNANPVITVTPASSSIISGESVLLTASGGNTYLWNPATFLSDPNIANPTATPTITTSYTVFTSDTNGCNDTAIVIIYVTEDCSYIVPESLFFLPSAFSPNGDGLNDVLEFRTMNAKCIKRYRLVVFDRWGEKVFETNDPKSKWDGTYREKPCNVAVFDYFMDVELITGDVISKKGNLSLIR